MNIAWHTTQLWHYRYQCIDNNKVISVCYRDNLPSIILGQSIISRKSNAQQCQKGVPLCVQLNKPLSTTSEYRMHVSFMNGLLISHSSNIWHYFITLESHFISMMAMMKHRNDAIWKMTATKIVMIQRLTTIQWDASGHWKALYPKLWPQ